MTSAYLLSGGIIALLLILIVIAIVVLKVRSVQRRKALEQLAARYHQSWRALLLYVMLNHQCSEEVAYQRLAAFVKKHIPSDNQSDVDRMLAQDRQSLLDSARNILAHDPNEIDKI